MKKLSKTFLSATAFISALIAFFLQALGYSGTCTGGDVGAFYVGALFSLPFISLSIALTAGFLSYPTAPGRISADTWWQAAVAVMMALLSYMNSSLVWGVLATGETPCFITYDFTDYRLPPLLAGDYEPTHIFIGLIYGTLPILLGLLSASSLLRHAFRQR